MDRIETIISESFTVPKTISVIFSSRERPELLKQSVESLYDTATKPDNIEILVRVDDNDPDTMRVVDTLNVKRFVGSYTGYSGNAARYNELFPHSIGEFIMLWGDDAVMETPGWDMVIQQLRGIVCIPHVRKEATCFVHRSIPTVWGIFAHYYCVEIIYKVVALDLGIYTRFDTIEVSSTPIHAAGRSIGTPLSADGWMQYRPQIYKLTDTLRPYVKPINGLRPLELHNIEDVGAGRSWYGNKGIIPSIG